MPADRIPQETDELDNIELTRLFSASGRRHGFTEVTAEYAPFRDFKIRWTRNYRWAEFEVSDYMADAPPEVMRAMAETIFRRICGDHAPYPQAVRDWLSAPDFIERKRPEYLERFEGFVRSPYGEVKDLSASLRRLTDAGLLLRDPDVVIGWSSVNSSRSVGTSSILMKTVSVSTALDREYVDDEILDYSLYALMARVSMGLNQNGRPRDEEYDDLLNRFPGRCRAEAGLRLLRLHI